MKALDFDLRKEIKFDFSAGITSFRETRLILFDANAIGLLRQNMIDKLGMEDTRAFFLRFGYQNGFADFLQMKVNYDFDNEMELLASGPTLHTWEGIVQATPTDIRFNREKGEFYFTGVWSNSYEADQHLSYNGIAAEPVCWSLMGYASGWCTAFFGSKVIAVEPHCRGKGDENCGWEIQPPGAWGENAAPYIQALKDF